MTIALLDTNVLLRHLLQDHVEHSPRSTEIFRRIESGELRVRLSDLVLFETVFTLQRQMHVPREMIRAALLDIIDLSSVLMAGKALWHRAFDLYVDGGLSFADAYHVVLMERRREPEIISFDTDFDGVPGIIRVEP